MSYAKALHTRSWLVSLMLTFFSLPALAENCPSMDLFQTELEALRAAMDSVNPRSIREDREFMGTIYRHNGGFAYSLQSGARHKDKISISIARSDLDTIVAFWHTHGDARPSNRYFSAADTALVNRFRKPLYLADYTGYLKRYSPGDRKLSRFAANKLGLGMQRNYAIGSIVRDEHNRPVKIATREEPEFS